jgi:hypothetical protein
MNVVCEVMVVKSQRQSRVMTDGQSTIPPCSEFLLRVANRTRHKVAVKVCVMPFDNANTDDVVGLSF